MRSAFAAGQALPRLAPLLNEGWRRRCGQVLSRNVEQKLLIYIAGFRIQLETLNLRLQRM